MKKNHTDITIVLDRSGSMQSIRTDTIGGFNSFLSDQQKAQGTASLSLHQFDDIHDTIYAGVPIGEVKPLTTETFVPRGSTALFDAIGKAINETGARLSKEAAEHVVFVIITDGGENASKEFKSAQIKEMIKHQTDAYNWQFVFLGANQDAFAAGGNIGVSAGNTMSFAANAAGVNAMYNSTSANLVSMRCGAKSSMAYSDEDRKKQSLAGVK